MPRHLPLLQYRFWPRIWALFVAPWLFNGKQSNSSERPSDGKFLQEKGHESLDQKLRVQLIVYKGFRAQKGSYVIETWLGIFLFHVMENDMFK